MRALTRGARPCPRGALPGVLRPALPGVRRLAASSAPSSHQAGPSRASGMPRSPRHTKVDH